MDERKAQLKTLKKAYNQDKRKYVTLWKVLGILFLALAILFGVVTVMLTAADNAMTDLLWRIIPELPQCEKNAAIAAAVRQAGSYMGFEIGVAERTLFWSAILGLVSAVFLLLFMIVLPLWSRGVRKFKKTHGYLDYKTMKKACKEEK